MQETIDQHEYRNLDPPPHTTSTQSGTALHLGLSHLIASAAALGFFIWLAHLHIQPLFAGLIALTGATSCGFLCTLNLQYNLYLLEMALSRFAQGQFHLAHDESNSQFSFVRRFPLVSLFLHMQEIEQRIRRYRINERLTIDVREQALQQAREAAALAERNRIARELHDSIKQQIFGINASAVAARMHWQNANEAGAREAIKDIERNAQGAQVEMQALLQQLRPAPLENTSLIEALHTQAQALEFRTGACVKVDLAALPEQDRLLPGTQEAIFRLVQESFANVARHARAQIVWLTLRTVGQELHITVRDDGQGFDLAHASSGMGISNLHERTHALQGHVEISSQPGLGTTVLISIPLLEALRNPAEEARQRYELARAEELARHEYRRCANACFLCIALGLIGIINIWATFISVDVLGALLVAIYGYVSGVYYRARVASSAGQESPAVLELTLEHYRAGLGLLLPINLGIWYFLKLATILGATPAPWFIIGIALCLVGLMHFSLRRDAKVSECAFGLLSAQEMRNELEKHQQVLSRSFMILAVASTTGLILNRALFVFPPTMPAQQDAYGLAFILLLIGMSHVLNYRYILRWKEQLRQRADKQSIQAKVEG